MNSDCRIIVSFTCALASAALVPASATADDWQRGQVFVNKGQLDLRPFRAFDGSGVFQEEFTTSALRVDPHTAFGPAFAADGRLYTIASGETVTEELVHRVMIVGNQHPHPILATTNTEAYAEFLTSIVFDAAGNFYVSSEVGFNEPAGIHKHTPASALIESIFVPVDPFVIDGVKWMDLAAALVPLRIAERGDDRQSAEHGRAERSAGQHDPLLRAVPEFRAGFLRVGDLQRVERIFDRLVS